MKSHSILPVALAICLCNPALAQSKTKSKQTKTTHKQGETIIIKKDDNNPQTVVEIKNGKVFVNGEEVAQSNTDASVHKKIIIDNSIDAPTPPDVSMPGAFGDAPAIERKAMLGVYTGKSGDGKGAEIERVMPNSAADKAGLKEGDIIAKIDGNGVANPKELTEIIANREAGDKVVITYYRDGKAKETEATLKEATPPENTARSYRYSFPKDRSMIPNPMMRPFWFDANDDPFSSTPKMGIEAEERADGDGVRIANVKPGSPAEKAGLETGDIITKIDDERINSVDDILEAIHTSKDRKVTVHYNRRGEKATTEVSFPKNTRKEDL